MAVNHIPVDQSNPYQQRRATILTRLLAATDDLQELVNTMGQMKDGGVVTQYLADKCGFQAISGGLTSVQNAAAGVAELESLNGKLNTDATVDHVMTAIRQASEKFA